jgi:hypothetical protein
MKRLLFAWPLAVALSVGACGPASPTGTSTFPAPSFTDFAGGAGSPGVHMFLEHRCGTLDCHGQTGRPFRLYSSGGLRLLNDAGLVSGGGADSPEEIYANYQSLVGVQPEETALVIGGQEPPRQLLVVGKPLGLVTHKGGQVLAAGDSSDACLEGWLTGHFDGAACSDAALVP